VFVALTIVRRVLNLAVEDGLITRNPALGIRRLVNSVARGTASEVRMVDAWTREEVETLLQVAENTERRFAPLLRFLLSTACRRGEALGLQWMDVDFDRGRVTIRRALTRGIAVTPKSGKARSVAMAPTLAACLFDVLAERRAEMLRRSWPELPEWVFCSEAGSPLDERNITSSWFRVRRRAHKLGVRPLKLHAARHTFATLAIEAGRSIRWVADQLGHADPSLTLRVYAHALPTDEHDLAFAGFEISTTADSGAKRLYPALTQNGRDASGRLDPATERITDGKAGDPGAIRTRDPQLRRKE